MQQKIINSIVAIALGGVAVALTFPCEKSAPAMQPVVKILYHLLLKVTQ